MVLLKKKEKEEEEEEESRHRSFLQDIKHLPFQ